MSQLILLGVSGLFLTSCGTSPPQSHTGRTKGDEPVIAQHAAPGKKVKHTSPDKHRAEQGQPNTGKKAKKPPRRREWDWKNDKKIAEANGWIWTGADVSEGFKQAQKTGKPLMVVLRCPP